MRADGSRVAWSEYGSVTGRPVLVVHSSMTTRFVSRRLLRALQTRGCRPIAIDLPGFGLSEPVAGLGAGVHNPFAAAVVMDCWQRTLPDAVCEILLDAGRLMAMTHADLIVARLDRG